jgi:hypothetical protein
MAILFLDSFDHYASNDILMKWDIASNINSFTIVNTNPRRVGTHYLQILRSDVTWNYLQKNFPSTDIIVIGFALFITELPESTPAYGLLMLRNASANTQFIVSVKSDGSIGGWAATSTGGTPVGSTPAGVISPNTWQYIEIKLTVANSPDGVFAVQVNGIEQCNVTGIDTQAHTTSGVTNIRFYMILNEALHFTNIDDLYILNDTPPNINFLGDCKIECLYPIANGALHQLTPSGILTNYECVDDPNDINGDTDYVEGLTVGLMDTYDMTTLTEYTQIAGVAETLCAKKGDVATRTIRGIVRIGGTNHYSASIGIADTYDTYQLVWDQNPATVPPGTWTMAAINAMEVGVELES